MSAGKDSSVAGTSADAALCLLDPSELIAYMLKYGADMGMEWTKAEVVRGVARVETAGLRLNVAVNLCVRSIEGVRATQRQEAAAQRQEAAAALSERVCNALIEYDPRLKEEHERCVFLLDEVAKYITARHLDDPANVYLRTRIGMAEAAYRKQQEEKVCERCTLCCCSMAVAHSAGS